MISLQELRSALLAPTRRSEPVRRHNGFRLVKSVRLAGGNLGVTVQHCRTVDGIHQEVERLRAQVSDEQSGFRRLLYGHLFVDAGLRGPRI